MIDYYQDHEYASGRGLQHLHAKSQPHLQYILLHKQHNAWDSTYIDLLSVMLHDVKDDHKSNSHPFRSFTTRSPLNAAI